MDLGRSWLTYLGDFWGSWVDLETLGLLGGLRDLRALGWSPTFGDWVVRWMDLDGHRGLLVEQDTWTLQWL